jgi:hypothetical protein
VLLPSECDTEIFLTVDILDLNGDPMTLEIGWQAPGVDAPSSGSVVRDGLTSGSYRIPLGIFDYRFRQTTIVVAVTLTGPTSLAANQEVLIFGDSGGECPSVFG